MRVTTDGRTSVLRALLCASSIATLLLFPLLNGLSSLPIWLHWTIFDSVETLCSWLLAAVLVGATLWLPAAGGRFRLRDAIAACWLVLGLMFVFAALAKVGIVAQYVSAYRSYSLLGIGAASLLVIAGATAVVWRPGAGAQARMERVLIFMWPLTALLMFHLARAPSLAAQQEGADQAHVDLPIAVSTTPTRPLRTVVLLFDEMSFDYLFGDRAIDMSALPALKRLRQDGEIQRDAHLHGGATAIAIPALFAQTPDAPQGLVNALKAHGRSIRVWGWYYDYCTMFTRGVDACHSTSVYNARTLHERFSLIDPWWTDMNLLPADRPFDSLKVPAAVSFHRRTLEAACQWLRTQLADPKSDFVYAHLNVPHLPLLSSTEKPFSMSVDGYLAQFTYVDSVVAVALADRTRPSQLIVMSDHNARPLFPLALHDHVVYVRYRADVTGRNVTSREDAAQLLSRMSVRDAEESLSAH